MSSDITALAIIAGPTLKILIDLVRIAGPLRPWVPPTLAVLGGVAIVLCGMVASGDYLSSRSVATAILAGIWAGANAVGITELGKRGAKK